MESIKGFLWFLFYVFLFWVGYPIPKTIRPFVYDKKPWIGVFVGGILLLLFNLIYSLLF